MFPKNDSSLYKGAFGGQPQGLSLRYVVVCFVSFATAFGCLSLTMQLLLFRKNHVRLACSFVNTLTTAHCRYQLLRFADRGKPCPYGTILFFTPCEAPTSFHFSLFIFLCPQGLLSLLLRKRWTMSSILYLICSDIKLFYKNRIGYKNKRASLRILFFFLVTRTRFELVLPP